VITSPRSLAQAATRTKIIEIAAQLLHESGPTGVTTRAVADGAGVQAPAIYRLFGDKEGLLEAVAEHVMATFVSAKAVIVEQATSANTDPLDDLRAGWQSQIDFGLANPVLFHLLSDPVRARSSVAARAGRRVLESRVRRVALAGKLRVAEDRAVGIIQAAGIGTIQMMVATPEGERDPGLPDAMYAGVLAQILTDAPAETGADTLTTSVAFRAIAPQLTSLSEAERHMLVEWLDRVITDS